MFRPHVVLAVLVVAAVALAAEPEKPKPDDGPALDAPADEEVDKPGKAGVAPPRPVPPEQDAGTAKPKEEAKDEGTGPDHVNPFRKRASKPKAARPARITFSDGKVVEGYVWRRVDGPIRIYNREARAHHDLSLSDLERIDVKPESENFEREWRWKNQGSSEKVFLDIGYLWNQYVTTFTSDGKKITGDCSGQFYILTLDGQKDKWYLYKRHNNRDKPRKKREEHEPLVYVKSVEFTDDFLKKAEEGKKAEGTETKQAEQK